jgi:unsaturated rhamnogalacturonyl hydrolase
MNDLPGLNLRAFYRLFCFILVCISSAVFILPQVDAQVWGEDAAPGIGLWKLKPSCPVPYGIPAPDEILESLRLVGHYIDENCPVRWVDLDTGQPLSAGTLGVPNPGLEFGLFSIISYEWGVTYAGSLRVAEVTGDTFFHDYVKQRLETIEQLGSYYLQKKPEDRHRRYVPGRLIAPHSLDSCGSMTAALIKAKLAGVGQDLDPFIEPSIRYISEGQKRLDDGTLARDRPLPNSLWLDDLYMSVPALAQMGKMTGEMKYFDDACRQIIQMNQRMYVPGLGLYRHGWVQEMNPHPTFPWGRANGWTIMAAAELLSVLPGQHPDFEKILSIYREHIEGIVRYQGINGFWHQLIDRPETYEETSATAMFVFAIARGVNRGWLNESVYAPVAILGWNAVNSRIDSNGAVKGTCVGTGIGWEAVFYAYRPTSPYAPHGYGPVLLAGAEILEMLNTFGDKVNVHDGAVHVGETPNLGF